MNPLTPEASLLVKLGSIAVHAEEMLSPDGHPLDKHALQCLLRDAEVVQWREKMNLMGLLPVKRK